jgi:hypothetical protein
MPSLNTPARAPAQSSQPAQEQAGLQQEPAPDLSVRARRQSAQRMAIDGSPAMAAQRERIQRAFGPAAAEAPVQRLTFKVERGDSEADAQEKQQHISMQDARLAALQTLYVNDAADTAMEGASPAHPTEATRLPGQPGPRGDKLLESWYVKFQSKYHGYTIDLVTSPDHDPRGDDPLVGTVRRIHEPFRIVRSSTLGERGDIGRTLAGGWAWAPNPNYRGLMNAPNLGGQFHPVPMPQPILPSMLHMPPDKRFGAPGTERYVPLPAPPTQPFIYYKDPGANDPTHQHDDRRDLPPTSTSLTLLMPPEGLGPSPVPLWQQSTFSAPPKKARKGSGRDPGKAMGGPASDLMPSGWSAAPRQGTQASHEWCHLVGDADGGGCDGLNLVIGTNQVNSEQLALENALRPFRPALEKLGRGVYIDARATGTLQPHSGTGQPVLQADWIKYTISVRSLDGSGEELHAHTDVMDATRGTITKGEFEALRAEAAAKLRLIVRQLQGPTLLDVPYGGVWPQDPQARQHPHLQHNQELFRGSPSAPGLSAPHRPVPKGGTDDDGFARPTMPASWRSTSGTSTHGSQRGEPYPTTDQARRRMAEQRARRLIDTALDETAGDEARGDARRRLRQLLRDITNTDLHQLILLVLQNR